MRKLRHHSALAVLVSLLVACGGSGNIGTAAPVTPDVDTGTGGTGNTPVFRAGALDGTTFTAGALALGSSQLSAGGQTSVSVDIVDSAGQRLVGTSVAVTFSSDCVSRQQSRVDPSTVTTTQGRATATYVAAGCSGSDVITASVVVSGGSTLTAQSTVTVAPAELGSVTFVSATPTYVGMVGSPIQNQSTLIFQVSNVNGGPVANTRVRFTPSNNVGGLLVSPVESISDASGRVQTTLSGGSAQTVVRVTASAVTSTGQTLVTQSEQLIVSTGIPDADSVSLGVSKLALDGRCDGDSSTIVIRLADRYNNPVPAGTAVAFTSEGGKINSGCFTGDPTADSLAEAGVCSVLFSVQNPRPAGSRVSLLASVLGEESFTDENSNGFWESSEIFTDMLEPFLDNNENGVRDSGEFFRDANGNDSYETAASGSFEGYVCDPTSPPTNCRSNTIPLGQNAVIAFSSGVPEISNIQGNQNAYPAGGNGVVSFVVSDTNGNSLPTGTTYTLALTNGAVDNPATQGIFNTPDPIALGYRFKVGTTATPAGGGAETATLTVTIPASGCGAEENITIALFNYTVTAAPAAP